MNAACAYDQPTPWVGLKPTWRGLWHQVRIFHSQDANRRAEQLVLRAMARDWSAARLESLLARLLERDQAPRDERHRHQGVPA